MNNFVSEKMGVIGLSGIRVMNEKALAMERAGKKVIHFEIGRPDFDTPAYIKEAAKESLDRGEVFYTSNLGDMGLREQIAKKLNDQNSIPCKAENILVGVGLSEAIFDALMAVLDPGDELLVPDPVWMNYVNVPKLLGAVPVSYTLKEENGYQIDLDEIREKITDRTKVLVMVTPNNPTGSILSRKTLEGLAEIAKEKDILVFADEVYERLLYNGAVHTSIASLPGMAERTFTFNGFSKTYSMTGWRLGYVCAPPEYIKEINKVHQNAVTCAPSFVQKAGIVAIRDEKDEVLEMVKEYERRRDYAVAAINGTKGLSCLTPDGAFYIFINCREVCAKSGLTSQQLAERFLEDAGICMVAGSVFGTSGEGYMRMSFANSYENVVEGCRIMKEYVEKLMA